MRIMKTLLTAFPFALFALSSYANEAEIREAIAARYAKVQVKSVNPTPIPGLYEVFVGDHILYADEKADHILMGPLVDTQTRTNLTQQRLDELKIVNFDSLPLDKAIKIVKGNGERRIAVFSDPDCPFCRRLEKELSLLDNLTIYVFLLPLAELHPQAVETARNIWCSADRVSAWNHYMLEDKKPAVAGDCQTPIADIATIANELGINGTPAIILADGRRLEGALPAASLEKLLAQSLVRRAQR